MATEYKAPLSIFQLGFFQANYSLVSAVHQDKYNLLDIHLGPLRSIDVDNISALSADLKLVYGVIYSTEYIFSKLRFISVAVGSKSTEYANHIFIRFQVGEYKNRARKIIPSPEWLIFRTKKPAEDRRHEIWYRFYQEGVDRAVVIEGG